MSSFTISIVAGKSLSSSSLKVSGGVQHVITNEEQKTFGLSEEVLKQAMAKYHNQDGGPVPANVYLHDPTPPAGSMFQNGFSRPLPQTTTDLVFSKGEILDVTSKLVALKTETFNNKSSVPATFSVKLEQSVTNTTGNAWNDVKTISVGQKIKYDIGFLGTGGGGSTSFNFSSSWGHSGTTSQTTTVGSSASVSVKVPPHKSVLASLSASRGVLKARIYYTATVQGGVVSYYPNRYLGSTFWWTPLGRFLESSGIPTSVECTEDITIDYYSSGTIVLTDEDTGEDLSTHCLPESVPAYDIAKFAHLK